MDIACDLRYNADSIQVRTAKLRLKRNGSFSFFRLARQASH